MSHYFELRCAVMEMFYGNILTEKYTVGQSADRCLVEFGADLAQSGRDALIILSCLLARLARHDRAALARFDDETTRLQTLEQNPDSWEGLGLHEKNRLVEDIRFIRKCRASKPAA